MSTAIAILWTSESIVIAADGRKVNAETMVAVDENTQKVFPVPNRAFGYALTGTVIITKPKSEDVVFDYTLEIPNILRDMRDTAQPSLWHFADELGKRLMEPLNVAITSSDAFSESKTDIFLAGYYKGPECVDLGVVYSTTPGQPATYEVIRAQMDLGVPIGYGSKPIWNRLHTGEDPAFEKYRLPARSSPVEIVKNCILAHCDPKSREIDPKSYAAIGGHVHVAQITEAGGFKWAIPPVGPDGIMDETTRSANPGETLF